MTQQLQQKSQSIAFTKQPYIEDVGPRKIESIQFSMMSDSEIMKAAEVQVYKGQYYSSNRVPIEGGLLDPRMGPANKSCTCATCHGGFSNCPGHYGYLTLALPVYNVGYLSTILDILKCICKYCSRLLLEEKLCKDYLKKMRNPKMEALRKTDLMKSIVKKCSTMASMVKKAVAVLGIIHDRSKVTESLQEFASAITHTKESKAAVNVATYMLNPVNVLFLFKRMTDADCEVLYLSERAEKLIITNIAVPPIAIRPSVIMDGSQSNENDITERLKRIIQTNASLQQELVEANSAFKSLAGWETLQVEVAQYINSDVRGVPFSMQVARPLSGFVQRLKGKQGRFRGNLSGKRVEYTGRTVISPDPNLKITEVAIPIRMARILTYPERVSDHNIEKVLYGKFRNQLAVELKSGCIVDRHLEDGDVVLFNRQPSLHRMSIMCHRARIMPWRTLRFNESVCNPYNADFDGDEMNMHVPQTEEARTEALLLMGVQNNLCTPKNGEILVASTQDFLTSSFLITRKDTFYDRAAFSLMCCYMGDGMDRVDLPTPAILKEKTYSNNARWIGNHGFSIGIDDVQPKKELSDKKGKLISENYEVCNVKIKEYNEGKLQLKPGCDAAQTLEAVITDILNRIREDAGKACMGSLPWRNSPLIMSQCGSKGSPINISQMVACVGQQSVGGRRAPNGFIDRSLPHFPRKAKEPAAKGQQDKLDKKIKFVEDIGWDDKSQILEEVTHKTSGITEKQLEVFIQTCFSRYRVKRVEAGTAIGAIGAQSIGEPGTQMTLKTFHFAGVASMNITQGVPRIKEIINGAKRISTPIITAELECNDNENAARVVKGRIEKTLLGQVAKSIKIVMTSRLASIVIALDMETIQDAHLCINADIVKESIVQTPKIKLKQQHIKVLDFRKLEIFPPVDKSKIHFELYSLKNVLPMVIVKGIKTVERVVIAEKEKEKKKVKENGEKKKYRLLVEGTGLQAVMGAEGIDGCKTKSNHIFEVQQTLGIEAARICIIDEINETMKAHGMSIDKRHMMLLADLMTFRGEVLGITRFGIQKMDKSVLMLASFEKTADHLFNASVNGRDDRIEGVSECIIMGIPMPLGTGILKIRQRCCASNAEIWGPRSNYVMTSSNFHNYEAEVAEDQSHQTALRLLC
ncbi:hypothetical protein CUMW_035030 [Citrus unshiu]|nr:hypothetical protein CUMW_035030 [Citrus unshiu]